MMKDKITLFIDSFIIWALLSWPLDIQHALVGILVAGLVVVLTGNIFARESCFFGHLSRYPWFFYYVPLFCWEFLKANIDFLIRLLNPKLNINPGIIKVKTTLKSDMALALLANSITLAPGTFCIDIDAKEGILYIHWMNVKSQDVGKATQLIARRFEKILKRLFE